MTSEQEKAAVKHDKSAKGNATKSIRHAQAVIARILNAKENPKTHCQDLDSANDTRAYLRRQPPSSPEHVECVFHTNIASRLLSQLLMYLVHTE